MLLKLTLALMISAASEAVAEEPALTLIEKVVVAYGGPALPEIGERLRQSGTIYSIRRGTEGVIHREARWPDYLRVEIDYGGGERETRLLVGEDGFRDGEPASAPMIAAMRLQAARLSLPMILQWEAANLRDLGAFMSDGGVPVRRVALSLGDGLTLFVEIDGESGRILRSAGVMAFGGAEMAFGANYSDPKAFGRLSWPAREDQTAMGRATGWTRITSVEVLPEPSEDELRP